MSVHGPVFGNDSTMRRREEKFNSFWKPRGSGGCGVGVRSSCRPSVRDPSVVGAVVPRRVSGGRIATSACGSSIFGVGVGAPSLRSRRGAGAGGGGLRVLMGVLIPRGVLSDSHADERGEEPAWDWHDSRQRLA